jgi:hypothetical protein
MPPKSQRERDAEKRLEKLEQMKQQVDAGSLSVRQMTPEERKRYGEPKPRPERPNRRS